MDYIDKYFETYPGVKAFLDKQVEDGKAKGYVASMFKRRRPIPELKSGNFNQKSFGERVAMNSPIHGVEASSGRAGVFDGKDEYPICDAGGYRTTD